MTEDFESLKPRAAVWFRALRDEVVAAFEALEDSHTEGPGSDLPSGEVTGSDRDKLIYGNILDAYGTDVFGQDVERGEEGRTQLERYSLLSRKKAFGASLSSKEETELNHLKQVFSTDAPLAL